MSGYRLRAGNATRSKAAFKKNIRTASRWVRSCSHPTPPLQRCLPDAQGSSQTGCGERHGVAAKLRAIMPSCHAMCATQSCPARGGHWHTHTKAKAQIDLEVLLSRCTPAFDAAMTADRRRKQASKTNTVNWQLMMKSWQHTCPKGGQQGDREQDKVGQTKTEHTAAGWG